jgi:hypothetical protein
LARSQKNSKTTIHLLGNPMNRPQKIKKIYRELRMMLGNEYPDYELLKSANLLIEIYEDDEPITLDQLKSFGIQFKDREVDEAIKDGGWRLMSDEGWWDQVTDDQDMLSPQSRAQLKNYGLELAA